MSYTTQALQNAMEAVENGTMSQRAAAKHFGVPRSTLQDHLVNKTVESSRGRPTYLTKSEEKQLEDWIFKVQDLGFPVTKQLVEKKVRAILSLKRKLNNLQDRCTKSFYYLDIVSKFENLAESFSNSKYYLFSLH
jgi:transposase